MNWSRSSLWWCVFFYLLNIEARLLGNCPDHHNCNQCAGFAWCDIFQNCTYVYRCPLNIEN